WKLARDRAAFRSTTCSPALVTMNSIYRSQDHQSLLFNYCTPAQSHRRAQPACFPLPHSHLDAIPKLLILLNDL
ncbi:hypothetical protein LEMLEM_LOCUS14289, partial [Lemmus lemmus]